MPKSLQEGFGRARVVVCLHTRSAAQARKLSASMSVKLEAIWAAMRLEQFGVMVGCSFVAPSTMAAEHAPAASCVTLTDAHALYRRLKGVGRGRAFEIYTERNMGYAIECLGSSSIDKLTRADSGRFRDHLIAKGLSKASIKRVFATVRAATKLAISENGLTCHNPFSGTFIPEVGEKTVRKPVPNDVLLAVQRSCQTLDDEKRWLIALISDTGLRLAEAVGLVRSDLKVDERIPHILVRVHPWRPLKTPSSVRMVPLVGASLWAAQRALANAEGAFLFASYASENGTNANSASAALNKWLRTRVPNGCVIHSFRHSLRDRLRAAECPADIVDAIGGWTTQGVGHGYGNGYPLGVLHRWMSAIVHLWNPVMHD